MDNNELKNNPNLGLEKLSLEQLEELLQQDFCESDDMDTDYTIAIMEVIKKRKAEDPNYKPSDKKAAWKDFEENYMNNESPYLHLFPSDDLHEVVLNNPVSEKRMRGSVRKLRRTVAAAAVLVLLFGMLTAQALGYEVFQSIARWTSDVFTFGGVGTESPPAPHELIELPPDRQYETIQEILDVLGISLHITPQWHPYGFVQTELNVTQLSDRTVIRSILEKEARSILMRITISIDSYGDHFMIHEINVDSVSIHEVGGITHYIMSNYDRMVAVWKNENLEVSIQGDITEADLLRMIDSIYGG